MKYQIELSDVPDETVRTAIARPLIEYNREKTGIADYRSLSVALRDESGSIIGGLWGRTTYGWLYVDLLVVPESLRGQGIGTALLRRAETEAAGRGCRAAWLDTFSFQARGFYEKLGYRCFGELADYPPGHARYFMTRRLQEDEG
jgi:GNAT superfamily N-acetyltransferase